MKTASALHKNELVLMCKTLVLRRTPRHIVQAIGINSMTVGRDGPGLLCKPNVRCYVHNSSPQNAILNKFNSLHTLTSCLFKIRFDILSKPRSPKLSLYVSQPSN